MSDLRDKFSQLRFVSGSSEELYSRRLAREVDSMLGRSRLKARGVVQRADHAPVMFCYCSDGWSKMLRSSTTTGWDTHVAKEACLARVSLL